MLKIIANIILFLFLAFNAYAGGGTVSMMVASGVATSSGTVYTDCSQFPTGYSFYYNGDYSGDTDTGCKGASTTIAGTLGAGIEVVSSGADPGTASPESDSNVLKLDSATNELVSWAITTDDIAHDDGSEGYASIDLYAAATTGNTTVNFLRVDANNNIFFRVSSDGTVRLSHTGNATIVTVDSTAKLPDTTWTNVQFRWSVSNNKIAIKIGDNAWQEDVDADAVTAFTSNATSLQLYCTAYVDTLYIDNFKVSKTSGF